MERVLADPAVRPDSPQDELAAPLAGSDAPVIVPVALARGHLGLHLARDCGYVSL